MSVPHSRYSPLIIRCSKTHNFLVFLQKVLHRGYLSFRLQTEPSFQNQDRNLHVVPSQNGVYPNTSSFLLQVYSSPASSAQVYLIFPHAVNRLPFHQCREQV